MLIGIFCGQHNVPDYGEHIRQLATQLLRTRVKERGSKEELPPSLATMSVGTVRELVKVSGASPVLYVFERRHPAVPLGVRVIDFAHATTSIVGNRNTCIGTYVNECDAMAIFPGGIGTHGLLYTALWANEEVAEAAQRVGMRIALIGWTPEEIARVEAQTGMHVGESSLNAFHELGRSMHEAASFLTGT